MRRVGRTVRGFRLEGDVADLVDDQRVSAQPGELSLQPPVVVRVGEQGDPLGGGVEQHPVPAAPSARRSDPPRSGSGSSPRRAPANTRRSSPAPAATRPAHARVGCRPVGTTDRTASAHLADTSSVTTVRGQVERAQLAHPISQDGDRPVPAHPLGDHRRRHRRHRPQQLTDRRLEHIHGRPRRQPLYRGGPSRRSAARTVFFEQPNRRAICLIGIASATCKRRISAQSSTVITLQTSRRASTSTVARGSVFTRCRQRPRTRSGERLRVAELRRGLFDQGT